MKKLLLLILPFLFIVGCGDDASTKTEVVAQGAKVMNEDTEKEAAETEVDSETVDSENAEEENTSSDTTEETANTSNDSTTINKEMYIKKLDEVEESLADLKEKVENGNQTEMNIAQDEIFKKWDEALNEVYGVLRLRLSEEEMELLRVDQRNWIEARDAAADAAADEFKGGTLAPFAYSQSLAEWTKERSYWLVKNYMDNT